MNLSYCMFENTSHDLQDCLYHMDEGLAEGCDMQEFVSDMSSHEKMSMERMVKQCRSFINKYEELEQNGVTE